LWTLSNKNIHLQDLLLTLIFACETCEVHSLNKTSAIHQHKQEENKHEAHITQHVITKFIQYRLHLRAPGQEWGGCFISLCKTWWTDGKVYANTTLILLPIVSCLRNNSHSQDILLHHDKGITSHKSGINGLTLKWHEMVLLNTLIRSKTYSSSSSWLYRNVETNGYKFDYFLAKCTLSPL